MKGRVQPTRKVGHCSKVQQTGNPKVPAMPLQQGAAATASLALDACLPASLVLCDAWAAQDGAGNLLPAETQAAQHLQALAQLRKGSASTAGQDCLKQD
jgi:hypothetical protein